MSYFLAHRVWRNHLNPEGLKPINRTIYATKQEATIAAYWRGICTDTSPLVIDADHEPGRTVLRTQCGP